MKILICDDEELIRNVIKEYCALEKYEVVEAENGKEAILKMDKDIDLIIMDIMMPEMDGFSTYKKIRESYNTPAIMLSARGEEYDKLLGFELGIDDYVTKPFSPKELIARIKAITKRNKQNVEYVDSLKVNVDIYTVLQLFLVSILLTTISSFISIMLALRYEPNKILQNR